MPTTDRPFQLTNPATGAPIGSVPKMGATETRRAIEAADKALPAWRAQAGQGARRDPAQVVRADAGQPGRPGSAHDDRAGQAVGGGQGRDRLRGLVHRVVRRGRQAHLRRRDSDRLAGPAAGRDQAAGRRVRCDHAVELSGGDDHAQGRARARCGLHRGRQARDADAVLGVCAGRACRTRGRSEGGAQRPDRQRQGDRWRADQQSDRTQDHVHRFHRSGTRAHAAERRDDQENLARARRQRTVSGVRRRRSGRRGGRRDDLQVSQRRTDLRVRQPDTGSGQGLRRVRREAGGKGEGAQGRARERTPA